jgi:L-lactate dehydrogenase
MIQSKIAIIGAGSVGTTTAYALILQNTAAEIILVDANEIRCRGEILDLSDVLPFSQTTLVHAGTMADAAQADIIIIAAGARQKPGQSRTELLAANKNIISSIITQLKPISPHTIIIMVSNPLDILTLHAQELTGLPRNQIFGTGTFLDSLRLRKLIAQKINVAEKSVHAYILGEHGDTQFPAWSLAHVDGMPLAQFPQLTLPILENLAAQARDKAYEIISCKDATFFGIATCAAKICHAILFDQKLILPLSTYQEKYRVCLSMPAILGKGGIEKPLDVILTKDEQARLELSALALKKTD